MSSGNCRGMATLTLLTALPFLIAILTASLAVFYLLSVHNRSLHLCRAELLAIEKERLTGIDRLLKMNPPAKALRIERKAVDAAVVAARALGPQALAAAKLKQTEVITRQNLFSLAQKALIKTTDLNTTIAMRGLRTRLQSELTTRAQDFRETANLTTPFRSTVNVSGISVRPAQKKTLTPDYKEYQLPKRHVMRLRWSFRPQDLLPTWIRLPGVEKLTFDAQCATTTEQEGERKWRPRLEKDKR